MSDERPMYFTDGVAAALRAAPPAKCAAVVKEIRTYWGSNEDFALSASKGLSVEWPNPKLLFEFFLALADAVTDPE